MRLSSRLALCLYALSIREGVFSETELPVYLTLGNLKGRNHYKRPGAPEPSVDLAHLHLLHVVVPFGVLLAHP
jgi:hypothetical protein